MQSSIFICTEVHFKAGPQRASVSPEGRRVLILFTVLIEYSDWCHPDYGLEEPHDRFRWELFVSTVLYM